MSESPDKRPEDVSLKERFVREMRPLWTTLSGQITSAVVIAGIVFNVALLLKKSEEGDGSEGFDPAPPPGGTYGAPDEPVGAAPDGGTARARVMVLSPDDAATTALPDGYTRVMGPDEVLRIIPPAEVSPDPTAPTESETVTLSGWDFPTPTFPDTGVDVAGTPAERLLAHIESMKGHPRQVIEHVLRVFPYEKLVNREDQMTADPDMTDQLAKNWTDNPWNVAAPEGASFDREAIHELLRSTIQKALGEDIGALDEVNFERGINHLIQSFKARLDQRFASLPPQLMAILPYDEAGFLRRQEARHETENDDQRLRTMMLQALLIGLELFQPVLSEDEVGTVTQGHGLPLSQWGQKGPNTTRLVTVLQWHLRTNEHSEINPDGVAGGKTAQAIFWEAVKRLSKGQYSEAAGQFDEEMFSFLSQWLPPGSKPTNATQAQAIFLLDAIDKGIRPSRSTPRDPNRFGAVSERDHFLRLAFEYDPADVDILNPQKTIGNAEKTPDERVAVPITLFAGGAVRYRETVGGKDPYRYEVREVAEHLLEELNSVHWNRETRGYSMWEDPNFIREELKRMRSASK